MEKLVQELLELNRKHSEMFVGQNTARDRHHANHPTNIAAFKCMDGRVDLARLTETPLGIIRPFRNIGGIFDIGWTALNAQLDHYVKTSVEKGRNILFLVTYHYAKGSRERGCRGHGYDMERAMASASRLVWQISDVFESSEGIYQMMIGVETDCQSLIFHGRSGERVSMVEMPDDAGVLGSILHEIYPDIHPDIVPDLLPLMRGNIRHLRKLREAELAPENFDHRERVIAIGQGFEWMPHNFVLAINDLELTLDDTIGSAAGIIRENRDAGRIPGSRALLMASVSYEEGRYSKALAIERARYLTRLGLDSVRKFHPDLDGFFGPLTCVMRFQNRLLEVIDD